MLERGGGTWWQMREWTLVHPVNLTGASGYYAEPPLLTLMALFV
jgi:hypothetical protein